MDIVELEGGAAFCHQSISYFGALQLVASIARVIAVQPYVRIRGAFGHFTCMSLPVEPRLRKLFVIFSPASASQAECVGRSVPSAPDGTLLINLQKKLPSLIPYRDARALVSSTLTAVSTSARTRVRVAIASVRVVYRAGNEGTPLPRDG